MYCKLIVGIGQLNQMTLKLCSLTKRKEDVNGGLTEWKMRSLSGKKFRKMMCDLCRGQGQSIAIFAVSDVVHDIILRLQILQILQISQHVSYGVQIGEPCTVFFIRASFFIPMSSQNYERREIRKTE